LAIVSAKVAGFSEKASGAQEKFMLPQDSSVVDTWTVGMINLGFFVSFV
jgi:hypothetical protein